MIFGKLFSDRYTQGDRYIQGRRLYTSSTVHILFDESQAAQALSVNPNYKGLYGILYKISMGLVKSEHSQ